MRACMKFETFTSKVLNFTIELDENTLSTQIIAFVFYPSGTFLTA